MNSRDIAQLMCYVSREELLKPSAEWMAAKYPKSQLTFKVGAGKRTYHTRKSQYLHEIFYGQKMVESKRQSAANMAAWLSGSEIIERGYYGGEITLLNTLAHTCCHEYAHFIQSLGGYRQYGSVHNKDFYRILDRFHASGRADAVRQALHSVIGDIQPLTNDQLAPLVKLKRGQKCEFDYNGAMIKATVTKVNKKTYSVTGPGFTGRVSFRCVTPVAA